VASFYRPFLFHNTCFACLVTLHCPPLSAPDSPLFFGLADIAFAAAWPLTSPFFRGRPFPAFLPFLRRYPFLFSPFVRIWTLFFAKVLQTERLNPFAPSAATENPVAEVSSIVFFVAHPKVYRSPLSWGGHHFEHHGRHPWAALLPTSFTGPQPRFGCVPSCTCVLFRDRVPRAPVLVPSISCFDSPRAPRPPTAFPSPHPAEAPSMCFAQKTLSPGFSARNRLVFSHTVFFLLNDGRFLPREHLQVGTANSPRLTKPGFQCFFLMLCLI